jgi:ABC-2 type transport system ATP-binding protein
MNTNTPSPYVVETAGLTKRFGDRTVVDNVELRVPRGSAFGYLGPNGAGKTTLIRVLLGLTPATAGTIKLRGLNVPEHRAEALSRIGAIVEEPRFHGHLTGRENLEIVAAARGPEAFTRIDASLARVGLANRSDDRVATYSLGMRQRLGIARCLLADPELLVLDEPLNGLDPAGIEEFRELIRSFVAEGRTIVISSHLLAEVERTCDAIAIVDRGRVVVQGSLDELRSDGAPTLLVASADNSRAGVLVGSHRAVDVVALEQDALHVRLHRDVEAAKAAADINSRLVEAGIPVHRLEPQHASLEQRFLEITTRLEDAA